MKNLSLSLSLSRLRRLQQKEEFIEHALVLLVSYVWESIEHYLETIAFPPIVDWFAGVEFWANRLIFDNLFVLFGYFFIKKYPHFITPARIFSMLWLFFHIFIFPDSMYLHEIFPFEVPFIWGGKEDHILDFWSIEHFFTGMSIGFLVIDFCRPFRVCARSDREK